MDGDGVKVAEGESGTKLAEVDGEGVKEEEADGTR